MTTVRRRGCSADAGRQSPTRHAPVRAKDRGRTARGRISRCAGQCNLSTGTRTICSWVRYYYRVRACVTVATVRAARVVNVDAAVPQCPGIAGAERVQRGSGRQYAGAGVQLTWTDTPPRDALPGPRKTGERLVDDIAMHRPKRCLPETPTTAGWRAVLLPRACGS